MTSSTALNQLSACLMATKQYHEVEKIVKKHGSADQGGDLRYYVCLIRAKEGNLAEALKECKLLLKENPHHELTRKLAFELLIHQATENVKEKNWAGIANMLGEALEMMPDAPEVRQRLSGFKDALPISLIKAGKRQEAAQIWQTEFLNQNHEFRNIHNLGLLYYWWAIQEEEKIKRNVQQASAEQLAANGELLDGLWERVIAYWVFFLNNDEFWQGWKQVRESVWGVSIREEDIKELRNSLYNDRLDHLFLDYMDYYRQNSRHRDSIRHENYLAELALERRSAGWLKEVVSILKARTNIRLDGWIKRFELFRAMQEADGSTPCYGTERTCTKPEACRWAPDCLSGRNQEVVLHLPAGYLFLKHHKMTEDVEHLCALLQRRNAQSEKLNRLNLYLSSMELGILLGLSEERKNPRRALEEWQLLPSDKKDSVEGLLVQAVALKELGKDLIVRGEIKKAFEQFLALRKIVKGENTKKQIKVSPYQIMFTAIEKDVEGVVVDTCSEECRKLKAKGNVAEAIQILEVGIEVADHPTLREHLAVFYVDRAHQKLNSKRFSEARKDAEKALSMVSGHKGAKELMAIAYNNEATDSGDSAKALELYKKANEYNPENPTVRSNLAGAYNRRAVELMNSISSYAGAYSARNTCDEAITLLEKGLKLLNPSVDLTVFQLMVFLDESNFDSQIRAISDDQYRTMLKNLWTAQKSKMAYSR